MIGKGETGMRCGFIGGDEGCVDNTEEYLVRRMTATPLKKW